MKLKSFDSPHIRFRISTRGVMLDAVLSLSFLYATAFYYYGLRAPALGAVSVLACCAADALCCLIAGRKPNPRDLSAIITGMILPLMMPASIPYYIVITAAVFAVAVAKHPFGGVGSNVFNPAAAGFSFAAICFGDLIFSYPPPAVTLPVFGDIGIQSGISPAFTLRLGGVPNYGLTDMLLGKYPGPMGATNILVLLACLLYLIFRGAVRWSMPVSFFSTVALLSFAFPRSDMLSGFSSVFCELTTGLVLFGGIFLLGDPVTTPKREMAKVAFGIVSGAVVILFRHIGTLEEEITFALLLMNAAVWGFDMLSERVAGKIRERRRDNENIPDEKAAERP